MESTGSAVDRFDSARQCLASGSAQNAACFVDVQLPGISGLDLQDKLAGDHNHVPIIFVSAQATQANRDVAMKLGAAGFLSKPFRRDDWVKLVGAAIQR